MDVTAASAFVRSLDPIVAHSFADNVSRMEALSAARALCMRLETPTDTVARLSMTEPTLSFVLKVAVDLHWFGILVRTKEGMSCDDLARESGAEAALTRKYSL